MAKYTEALLNVGTGLMVVAALGLAGYRAVEYVKTRPPGPRKIDNAAEFAGDGHGMGPAGAAVTIVEFADYQCPFCATAEPVLRGVRDRYPTDVRVVFRHFPLTIHDSAVAAARAAECAAEGGAFERFHEYMFANADQIEKRPWHWFAENAGVADLRGFDRCVASGRAFPSIQRDREAGERLGVDATPSFLIDDFLYTGLPDATQLDRLIRRAIEQKRREDD